MKTRDAITLARTATNLASLLGITASAVSQWPDEVPPLRVYQLRVLKPEWFDASTGEVAATVLARADAEQQARAA